MKKYPILIILLGLTLLGCQNENFLVIDHDEYNDKLCVITVYAPDTSWTEMETYASELLKDKHQSSVVLFFHPKEKVPDLNGNSYRGKDGKNYYQYLIGRYVHKEEANGFVLERLGYHYKPNLK